MTCPSSPSPGARGVPRRASSPPSPVHARPTRRRGPAARPRARWSPILLLPLLASTAGLRAQSAAVEVGDEGLSGVVVTGPEERPLAGAEVRVVGASRWAVTDSTGRFFLPAPDGGSIRLTVRHRGVRAGPVEVERPAGADVRLRFAPGAVAVPEIEVTVRRRSDADARLSGFHRRLRRGGGHFLTATQIARRDPSRLSHMFRAMPGLTVVRREFGGTVVSDRPGCRLEFFVDGVRSSFLRVDALRPGDVAGIEVYHGTSRVPPEFVRPDYCGAVVVWTRVPGDPEEP